MTQWENRVAELLSEARELRPPKEARHRVRQRLGASIALSTLVASPFAAKAAPVIGAKLAAAVKAGFGVVPGAVGSTFAATPVALLAPVTLGLALGLSAIVPGSVEERAPQSMTHRAAPHRNDAVAPRRALAASATSAAAAKPPESLPNPTPPATTQVPTPPQTRSSLARQSELVEHARLVLRQGDPTLSLRSIELYRREFPNGAFFVEAVTLQASALCQLNRLEEGRNLLRRLEASQVPPAALAQAVRHCHASKAQ